MSMGGPGDGEDDGDLAPLSEINVTPMVDVMLVLLIVFMIAAPLMMVGVPVNLPRTSAARVQQVREPVVVSLDREGSVFVREARVAEGVPGLDAVLRPLAQATPDQVVYVRADRGIPYGRVMELMGAVSRAGVSRLSLLAEAAAPPGPGGQRAP